MRPSVRTVTFLCGNQQASLLGPGDLNRGNAIHLAPETNCNHCWAVATRNGQGMHVGYIAREPKAFPAFLPSPSASTFAMMRAYFVS